MIYQNSKSDGVHVRESELDYMGNIIIAS